jgi:hypothetical protein
MAARLAVVCLAAMIAGCGGGGDSTAIPASPQWARARSDSLNSGVGASLAANEALGSLQIQLNGGPIETTPAIGVSGNVFTATRSGRVFALSPSLEPLWEWNPFDAGFDPPIGEIRSSPAVDPLDIVYFGTDGGWVVSVSGGLTAWATPLGSAVVGSPLLIIDSVDNDVQALFVATSDGRVVGLGGQDGQVRWQVATGGGIDGSLAFDGLNLYAASADGFLYTLSQRGTMSFPPAGLGATAPPFRPSPSLLSQVIVVTGLAAESGGRVRGFSASGTTTIWDALFPAATVSSPTQLQRAVVQVFENDDGSTSENTISVTDYVVVDLQGAGWLVDAQLGSFGTRCIGGPDDQKSCRSDSDCEPPQNGSASCQPIHQCVGGDSAGVACRPDMSDDCPGGTCTSITECAGGSAAGSPCSNDGDCSGGTCNLAVFSVGATVEASPVSTGDGTLLVATAPATGAGIVYAIDLPSQSDPLPSSCPQPAPAFCRFAFPATAAVRASPSVASDSTIYFGDDSGVLFAILGAAP